MIRRLRALLNLARGQKGTPEGQVAQEAADRIRKRRPELAAKVDDEVWERRRIPCSTPWESEALLQLARNLDLEHKTPLPDHQDHARYIWLSGGRAALDRAEELWPEHRYRLEGMTRWMASSYAAAAFPPLPPRPTFPDPHAQPPPEPPGPTRAETDAATCGRRVGQRHRPSDDTLRALPPEPPVVDLSAWRYPPRRRTSFFDKD